MQPETPATDAADRVEMADLREEVAYWRRDATARVEMAAALMRAYRKEGRDDLAYAHHAALGAAVSASEEVRRKDWHAACEICGEPLLPGQSSCGSDDITFAHTRCMVEGDDTPDREDPTDVEWAAATTAGRAAMREDAERLDEPTHLLNPPSSGAGAAGLEGEAIPGAKWRVEAGAVAGDLGGVKALDDALDAYDRAIRDLMVARGSGVTHHRQIVVDRRAAVKVAHLAIKNRELDALRRSGAEDDRATIARQADDLERLRKLDEALAGLRALSDAATPGPWAREAYRPFGRKPRVLGQGQRYVTDVGNAEDEPADIERHAADAALIVAAVNLVRAQIARPSADQREGADEGGGRG